MSGVGASVEHPAELVIPQRRPHAAEAMRYRRFLHSFFKAECPSADMFLWRLQWLRALALIFVLAKSTKLVEDGPCSFS
jgi:hypothetical protein